MADFVYTADSGSYQTRGKSDVVSPAQSWSSIGDLFKDASHRKED